MPYLAARYDLEHQTGAELQVTFGNVILKSEDVFRVDVHARRSHALSAGGEYDLGSVLHSGQTFSLFAEYYFDSRSQSLVIPFRNDVFAGTRVGLNDRRSSEVRVWGNYDLSARKVTAIMVDASARLSERLKAVVAYRGIVGPAGRSRQHCPGQSSRIQAGIILLNHHQPECAALEPLERPVDLEFTVTRRLGVGPRLLQ